MSFLSVRAFKWRLDITVCVCGGGVFCIRNWETITMGCWCDYCYAPMLAPVLGWKVTVA